jgi:hypothetical protein
MIIDMGNAEDTPLILGHPFLNTTNACIYVASGQIQFYLAKKEIFAFASGQPVIDEKQEKKKHPKRIKMKNQSQLKSQRNLSRRRIIERWRKKKDPSSNSSSPDPDPNKVLTVVNYQFFTLNLNKRRL